MQWLFSILAWLFRILVLFLLAAGALYGGWMLGATAGLFVCGLRWAEIGSTAECVIPTSFINAVLYGPAIMGLALAFIVWRFEFVGKAVRGRVKIVMDSLAWGALPLAAGVIILSVPWSVWSETTAKERAKFPVELWSFTAQNAGFALAANGPSVYVGDKLTLHSLDALTGRELWVAIPLEGFDIRAIFATSDAVVALTLQESAVDAVDLYGLDPRTGALRWKHGPFSHAFETGVQPFASASGVYIGDKDGRLYAIDPTAGEPRWTVDLGPRVLMEPFASDGIVYYLLSDGVLVAADERSGAEAWHALLEKISPIVSGKPGRRLYWGSAQGAVLILWSDRQLWRLDAKTGSILWSVTSDIGASPEAPPLAHRDMLYLWSREGPTLYGLDVATGAVRFRRDDLSTYSNSSDPIAALDNLVVVGGRFNEMYGLDALTGKTIWRQSVPASSRSSYVIRTGVGYFAYTGHVTAIDLRTGKELWTRGTERWDGRLAATDEALLIDFSGRRLLAVPLETK